jgi:hypothetical protein
LLPFTRNDNSCSTGLLETSNQKNIPKFLVVRDELPANHQGRAGLVLQTLSKLTILSNLKGFLMQRGKEIFY